MRQKRISLATAAVLLLVLSLAGCATTNTAPAHPNQINAFDGAAYDTLITIQGSLLQAKALAPQFPQFKTELNDAISGYNSAMAAYKLYHAAAAGAPSTVALQTQVTTLVTSVAKLLADLGVKP